MKVIKNLFFLSVLVMSFYACSTDELNAPIETSNKPNEIVHRTLSFEEFYNTFSNDKALLGKEIHTLAQTRKERLKKHTASQVYSQTLLNKLLLIIIMILSILSERNLMAKEIVLPNSLFGLQNV